MNPTTRAVVYYETGRLLAGQLRGFLKSEKFLGHDIDWIESDGFFTRTFTIKGESYEIQRVCASIDAWAKENNLVTQ